MIFDFAIVLVSIVILTLLTSDRKNIIEDLAKNSVVTGILITVIQVMILVNQLENTDDKNLELVNLVIMLMIKLRPLLAGFLFKIAFWICGKITNSSSKKSEQTNESVTTSSSAKTPVQHQLDLSLLSRREIEVAHLAAKGYTNAQIAQTLYISSETVKRHMASIFEKLGIESRKELML